MNIIFNALIVFLSLSFASFAMDGPRETELSQFKVDDSFLCDCDSHKNFTKESLRDLMITLLNNFDDPQRDSIKNLNFLKNQFEWLGIQARKHIIDGKIGAAFLFLDSFIVSDELAEILERDQSDLGRAKSLEVLEAYDDQVSLIQLHLHYLTMTNSKICDDGDVNRCLYRIVDEIFRARENPFDAVNIFKQFYNETTSSKIKERNLLAVFPVDNMIFRALKNADMRSLVYLFQEISRFDAEEQLKTAESIIRLGVVIELHKKYKTDTEENLQQLWRSYLALCFGLGVTMDLALFVPSTFPDYPNPFAQQTKELEVFEFERANVADMIIDRIDLISKNRARALLAILDHVRRKLRQDISVYDRLTLLSSYMISFTALEYLWSKPSDHESMTQDWLWINLIEYLRSIGENSMDDRLVFTMLRMVMDAQKINMRAELAFEAIFVDAIATTNKSEFKISRSDEIKPLIVPFINSLLAHSVLPNVVVKFLDKEKLILQIKDTDSVGARINKNRNSALAKVLALPINNFLSDIVIDDQKLIFTLANKGVANNIISAINRSKLGGLSFDQVTENRVTKLTLEFGLRFFAEHHQQFDAVLAAIHHIIDPPQRSMIAPTALAGYDNTSLHRNIDEPPAPRGAPSHRSGIGFRDSGKKDNDAGVDQKPTGGRKKKSKKGQSQKASTQARKRVVVDGGSSTDRECAHQGASAQAKRDLDCNHIPGSSLMPVNFYMTLGKEQTPTTFKKAQIKSPTQFDETQDFLDAIALSQINLIKLLQTDMENVLASDLERDAQFFALFSSVYSACDLLANYDDARDQIFPVATQGKFKKLRDSVLKLNAHHLTAELKNEVILLAKNLNLILTVLHPVLKMSVNDHTSMARCHFETASFIDRIDTLKMIFDKDVQPDAKASISVLAKLFSLYFELDDKAPFAHLQARGLLTLASGIISHMRDAHKFGLHDFAMLKLVKKIRNTIAHYNGDDAELHEELVMLKSNRGGLLKDLGKLKKRLL